MRERERMCGRESEKESRNFSMLELLLRLNGRVRVRECENVSVSVCVSVCERDSRMKECVGERQREGMCARERVRNTAATSRF